MPLDYSQLQRDRQANHVPKSDWDQREKLIVDAARAEFAEQRDRETQERELAAAVTWCERKSAAASKAGDPDDTALWTRAASTLADGKWPISRRIASSPDVTLHQACRTRLLYAGQTARIED